MLGFVKQQLEVVKLFKLKNWETSNVAAVKAKHQHLGRSF